MGASQSAILCLLYCIWNMKFFFCGWWWWTANSVCPTLRYTLLAGPTHVFGSAGKLWNIVTKKIEEKIATIQARIQSWTSSSTVYNVTSMPTGAQCCCRGLKVPYKWKTRCCMMLVRFALQNYRCGCLAWDCWTAVCMRGRQINSQCCEGTFYCRANGHHTCTQN